MERKILIPVAVGGTCLHRGTSYNSTLTTTELFAHRWSDFPSTNFSKRVEVVCLSVFPPFDCLRLSEEMSKMPLIFTHSLLRLSFFVVLSSLFSIFLFCLYQPRGSD